MQKPFVPIVLVLSEAALVVVSVLEISKNLSGLGRSAARGTKYEYVHEHKREHEQISGGTFGQSARRLGGFLPRPSKMTKAASQFCNVCHHALDLPGFSLFG